MSAFTLRLLISAAALVQSTGLGWGPPPKLKSVSHQLIGSNSFDQSQVPWNEINAAWGQAALLLFTLAKQCAFHFTTYVQESFGGGNVVHNSVWGRYDIVPKGSFSYMLRQSDKYHCELSVLLCVVCHHQTELFFLEGLIPGSDHVVPQACTRQQVLTCSKPPIR